MTEQLAVAKERPHQLEVVQMGAAVIGIIENVDIAIGEFALGLVDHRLDRERHGADKDWQTALALHQSLAAVGVIQAVRGVMRLGDDGIEGGTKQRGIHLVGDLFQPAIEHRQRYRIDGPDRLGLARARTGTLTLVSFSVGHVRLPLRHSVCPGPAAQACRSGCSARRNPACYRVVHRWCHRAARC